MNGAADQLFLGQSGLLSTGTSTKLPNHNVDLRAAKNAYTLPLGEDTLVVPLTWTDNNGLNYTKPTHSIVIAMLSN